MTQNQQPLLIPEPPAIDPSIYTLIGVICYPSSIIRRVQTTTAGDIRPTNAAESESAVKWRGTDPWRH